MCPSFRVTKDEKHSTRGRVRLLSELFRGESPESPWDSEEMKEALDLCFACKSCKNECPVQVDMATYKSEFLSHYYESRPRPMHAYAMGRIDRWARCASLAPRVTNFAMRMPVVGRIAAAVCGLTRQRPIPEFAHRTFVRWFKSRVNGMRGRSKVILWPDTFNNNFHPQVAIAATRVLEAYGFEVILPPTSLCCGRPLYDFGMIDAARGQLARIMHALEPDIVAGTPIVALEPACASVFKDELVNLFPDDAIAQRLSRQVSYFSDFLHPLRPPRQPVSSLRAIVHGHCHHKAVLGFQSEIDFLRKIGIDAKPIEAGCCGMAGSIGFRSDTYSISVRAAELDLLPAIRESAADELIITSGFSCREQVAHLSDRKSMHVAEAVAMALDIGHSEAHLI
jgi:Fe-S oxidoreductase